MKQFSQLPEIKTPSLLLRASVQQDADAVYQIYSHPDVVRCLDHSQWSDISQAETLIQSAHEGLFDDSLFGWCVVLRETDEVIGTCALFDHNPEHRTAEIAFAIHPTYWCKGLVSEVLPALVEFGFGQLNLNRIHADVAPNNLASLKALKKVGFVEEGRLRECWISPGETNPSDTILLGLLKSDLQL